mgnify:FL=1
MNVLWRIGGGLAMVALVAGCSKAPQRSGGTADGEAAYDPATDPLVNPATMTQEVVPAEAALGEWLYCTLDGNPKSLNPLFGSSTYEFRMNGFLFDGPFTFDAEMRWKLNDSMVESLDISEDQKVWTLTLKPGLTWHDGTPFTAHDIAFSWKEILDERVPCPAQKPGTDEIERCEAVDDRTVRFVHKNALPTSKWNVFFSIIPKHVYEKGKEEDPTLQKSEYHARVNRAPVGNGPYRFVEWQENDKIVLERWDGYHGPKPHFARIVCRIIPDSNVQLLTFEKGDTDELRLDPKQFAVETVGSKSFARVGHKALGTQWGFYYIGWNMDGSNPFFHDVRVRRAMTHALNLPLIIQEVGYNLVTPCHGIYHPEAPYAAKDIQLIPYDLEQAALLLDEAGWKVDEETGWRTKDGTRFTFTLTIPQGSSVSPQIAAIFEQDLRRIGVEMKQQVLEWATFQQRTREAEFQAQIAGWGTGTDPDTGWNLWHSSEYKVGRNYGKYANARVDELLKLGRFEFDEEKRFAYYAEMQRIIYDEQPYTFIWNASTLWGFNKRIRGVGFSPRGVWNFDPSSNAWWVHESEQMYGLK